MKFYLGNNEIENNNIIETEIKSENKHINTNTNKFEEKNKTDGILCYGTNASGKSSLMKAVGLSIIMAQMGMFVPCSKLVFRPFHQVLTRITDGDNIFKGQSSFVVEMMELRTILEKSR